ncbi:MAG: HEAT repeat domain-containing protein [Chloroflexota bacterium]
MVNGPTPNETDIEQLIQNLCSSDRFVRSAAALALGQRRAVEGLIKLLDDKKTVWDAAGDAAWALGEIGDLRAVEPLIAALDHVFVAGRAIESLEILHDERTLEPLIRYFERTMDPSVATVLGNWGDRRAVESLIAAMDNPNPHVRFYAARALGKLADDRALSVLEHAIVHDTEPILDTNSLRGKSVAYVAAKAIERIKSSLE